MEKSRKAVETSSLFGNLEHCRPWDVDLKFALVGLNTIFRFIYIAQFHGKGKPFGSLTELEQPQSEQC